MTTSLTDKQMRFLRGRSHALKAVIQIGQKGLSDSVRAETARALFDHELIKVRLQAGDREARAALLSELLSATDSQLVARIGHIAVLYKPSTAASRMVLPDA
jgi:RNA-binding protein